MIQKRRSIILFIVIIIGALILFFGIRWSIYSDKKIIWRPALGDRFQWQFTGTFDSSIDADIYSLDLFDTSEELIKELHKSDKKVICYVNVGAWEDWRPDANNFPKEIIGNDYIG